tara:strand:+ start:389 stop:586 length:198 start_codon:yes stop_codon:yes gene_type:complete
MRYETTESFYNAHAKKLARWDAQQAISDAAGNQWVFPSRETMKANPRALGESLTAYSLRLKEGGK